MIARGISVIGMVCVSAAGGLSPGGLVDAERIERVRSRTILIDELAPSVRLDGDEDFGPTFGSGSGSGGNPGAWLTRVGNGADFFFNSDSMSISHSGSVLLTDRTIYERVQGISANETHARALIVEPVRYTITIEVIQSVSQFIGDADATLLFDTGVTIVGADGPVRVSESRGFDLVTEEGAFQFEMSGTYDPGDSTSFMLVDASSSISAVIDGAGEQAQVNYSLQMEVSFEPIPSPGGVALMGSLAFIASRRRR